MVSTTVTEYLDYATVHGLGRLNNAPFKLLKLLWALCLCGSFGMIIFQLKLLIDKYQRLPISTSVQMLNPNTISFPVVTICNTNPLSNDLIPDNSTLKTLLDTHLPISTSVQMLNPDTTSFPVVTICNTNPLSSDLIPANSTLKTLLDRQIFKYGVNQPTYEHDEVNEHGYVNASSEVDVDILWSTTELFEMAMNGYTTDELAEMSQELDEFVLVCTYNGDECSKPSIQRVRTYQYGICYNIYPEWQSIGTRKVAESGKRYGLQLLLNIDALRGVPFVTQSSGVYVMVHHGEYGMRNLFLYNGVVVPSGHEADVQITETEEIRVPRHASKPRCNNVQESLQLCMHKCQQAHIAATCGCYQYYFDVRTANKTHEYGPCTHKTDYECIREVRETYIHAKPLQCSNCRVPCKERLLKTVVSTNTWPANSFVPVLNRILSSRWGEDYVASMDQQRLWSNLAMVNIYLSDMSYQATTEEYSYSEVNLLSDIGGTLGLWAGFSILSIVEVGELFFLLGAKRRQEMNQRKNVLNVEPSEMDTKDTEKQPDHFINK